MNEFVAKKLGEVLAFNQVGTDTLEKGKTALVAAIGEERFADMEDKNRIHADAIIKIVTDAGMIDTTTEKAAKTGEKLKSMRELYVGDQWDNATELMEWSGFFEGAAVVHWALVRGAAEGMNDGVLLELANEGVNWHYELIELAESELATTGQNRATQ